MVRGSRLERDLDAGNFSVPFPTAPSSVAFPKFELFPYSNQYWVEALLGVTSPFRFAVVLDMPFAASVFIVGALPTGGGLPSVVLNEYCEPVILPY